MAVKSDKELHALPTGMPEEELAYLMYKQAVIADMWKTEQDSVKRSYYNQAQRILTLIKNAGYDIVKREKK